MSNESSQPPIHDVPHRGLRPGTALCLSGGGFRAMLFHVGGIRRLAELGVLGEVEAVSSVSGGSITSAAMAMHWTDGGLDVDAFERAVFDFAGHTLDVRAVLGAWIRLRSVSSRLAHLYDSLLLDGRSLQDVPNAPLFVFDTTNMHTGNSFQWTKEAAHDYAVGRIAAPDVRWPRSSLPRPPSRRCCHRRVCHRPARSSTRTRAIR